MILHSEVMGPEPRHRKEHNSFMFIPESFGIKQTVDGPIAVANFDVAIDRRRYYFSLDVVESRELMEHLRKFLNSDLVQK